MYNVAYALFSQVVLNENTILCYGMLEQWVCGIKPYLNNVQTKVFFFNNGQSYIAIIYKLISIERGYISYRKRILILLLL